MDSENVKLEIKSRLKSLSNYDALLEAALDYNIDVWQEMNRKESRNDNKIDAYIEKLQIFAGCKEKLDKFLVLPHNEKLDIDKEFQSIVDFNLNYRSKAELKEIITPIHKGEKTNSFINLKYPGIEYHFTHNRYIIHGYIHAIRGNDSVNTIEKKERQEKKKKDVRKYLLREKIKKIEMVNKLVEKAELTDEEEKLIESRREEIEEEKKIIEDMQLVVEEEKKKMIESIKSSDEDSDEDSDATPNIGAINRYAKKASYVSSEETSDFTDFDELDFELPEDYKQTKRCEIKRTLLECENYKVIVDAIMQKEIDIFLEKNKRDLGRKAIDRFIEEMQLLGACKERLCEHELLFPMPETFRCDVRSACELQLDGMTDDEVREIVKPVLIRNCNGFITLGYPLINDEFIDSIQLKFNPYWKNGKPLMMIDIQERYINHEKRQVKRYLKRKAQEKKNFNEYEPKENPNSDNKNSNFSHYHYLRNKTNDDYDKDVNDDDKDDDTKDVEDVKDCDDNKDYGVKDDYVKGFNYDDEEDFKYYDVDDVKDFKYDDAEDDKDVKDDAKEVEDVKDDDTKEVEDVKDADAKDAKDDDTKDDKDFNYYDAKDVEDDDANDAKDFKYDDVKDVIKSDSDSDTDSDSDSYKDLDSSVKNDEESRNGIWRSSYIKESCNCVDRKASRDPNKLYRDINSEMFMITKDKLHLIFFTTDVKKKVSRPATYKNNDIGIPIPFSITIPPNAVITADTNIGVISNGYEFVILQKINDSGLEIYSEPIKDVSVEIRINIKNVSNDTIYIKEGTDLVVLRLINKKFVDGCCFLLDYDILTHNAKKSKDSLKIDAIKIDTVENDDRNKLEKRLKKKKEYERRKEEKEKKKKEEKRKRKLKCKKKINFNTVCL